MVYSTCACASVKGTACGLESVQRWLWCPHQICLLYAWFSHSNTPCDIRLICKLNRHLTGQGTEMLLQVPLWKLAGVTLICREVLHLWRARRIALMDVLETIGQWLSLTGGPLRVWWQTVTEVPRSLRPGPHTVSSLLAGGYPPRG